MSWEREAPASVGQRLLWFLARRRNEGLGVNCPLVLRFDGPVDRTRLQDAVTALVRRHESLRTTLEWRHRSLVQRVGSATVPAMEVRDVSDLALEGSLDDVLAALLNAELCSPIDPGVPPVRATLLVLGPRCHVLCLNVAHTASDAWSGVIQARELASLYVARDAPDARGAPMQYIEWTEEQRRYLDGAGFAHDLRYWSSTLEGAEYDALPLLPIGSSPPEYSALSSPVARDEAQRAGDIARQHNVTPFAVMLGSYYLALHRLTGRLDVSVASIFANRVQVRHQGVVGFLANPVVLRCTASRNAAIGDVAVLAQQAIAHAFVHQACPLHLLPTRLTSCAGRRGDEVVFQMLPHHMEPRRVGDLLITPVAPRVPNGRFAFEVSLATQNGQPTVIVNWDARRASRSLVENFVDLFHESLRPR
jgi:hypothetical protein